MARPQSQTMTAPAGRAPRLAKGGPSGAPKLPPLPPFLLVAHPDRWCVIEGMVLPLLHEFRLEPGVNGCVVWKDPDTGELVYDTDGCESNLRSKGATPIDWYVDGPDAPYLTEVAPGRWLSRWQHPVPGSSRLVHDLPGYAAWVRDLQDRGVLPRVGLDHLERLEAVVRFDLEASRKAEDSYRCRQLERQLEAIADEKPAAERRHEEWLEAQRKRGVAPSATSGSAPRLGAAPEDLQERMERSKADKLTRLPAEVLSQGGEVGTLGEGDPDDGDEAGTVQSSRRSRRRSSDPEA